jgi:hypothetical protein
LDNATSSAYADLSSSLLNNDNDDASVVDGDDEDGDDVVYAGVISAVRVRSVVSSIVRRLQLSVGSDDLDETSRLEDDETRLLIRAARTVGGTRSRAYTLVFGDEEEVVVIIIIAKGDVLLHLGIVERRTTPRP